MKAIVIYGKRIAPPIMQPMLTIYGFSCPTKWARSVSKDPRSTPKQENNVRCEHTRIVTNFDIQLD